MHDALTIGIPVFVILLGILLNRQDVGRLEARMDARLNQMESHADARFDRVENRLERVETDLREFFKIQVDMDKRVDRLERK